MTGTPEGESNLDPRRAAWQREHLGAAARDLLQRDAAVFVRQSLSTPCLNALAGAEGSELIDVDGRRYLDFHGNSVHQLGHGHPKVVEAIQRALASLPFSPRRYTNEPAVRLAERLAEAAPRSAGSNRAWKVLFVPGGAEAVGLAIKLVRAASGRHKTVGTWGAFHGASLEAASLGGEALFRSGVGPLLPGGQHVPPPDPWRCPLGCVDLCQGLCGRYLAYVLEQESDVAAVVSEPIRCTTAVAPPPEYWPMVRAACDAHGTRLIFDEIPIGLGRTGRLFAAEHSGIVPDAIVLGKGLGGGIWPLAAVLVQADLDVVPHLALGHYTHEKSPVGAAAGLATLDVIDEEGLVARSERLGAEFLARLRQLQVAFPGQILDVRAVGLLAAVECRDEAVAQDVLYGCLTAGLSFKVSSGRVLTLTPPLNIAEPDLHRAADLLADAFAALS